MQQAHDFRDESAALDTILEGLSAADYDRVTAFKDWTINNVLQHLHYFNLMAGYSAIEPERFAAEYARFGEMREAEGGSMVRPTDILLEGLSGPDLRAAWRETYEGMVTTFSALDPKARVKWAGPDMSVRSSITARQMETWAHAQEVFDVLGLDRDEHDRIRNVVHLSYGTYGWTFINRGETVPEPAPFARLTAPSGAVWEYGQPSETEVITGSAVEFCQVAAQTRNIADTSLSVTGPNAVRWMSIAQCFAGPPHDPPAPGTRVKAD
ncbi:MAG: TIGR03084 family metal-binding protein [Pseudomonadota bacterium]